MNTRHRFGLALGFLCLSSLVSVLTAPDLPATVVTTWGPGGDPQGSMPTDVALWLLPAVTAGLIVLFALIPRIDPLRENIATFRAYFDWFVVLLAAYMFVLHAGIVAFNLGYEFDFLVLVLLAAAALLYYTGIVLSVANQNWFVGIRTPWTLSSDEVWNRTHAIGSGLFKLTAILTVVGVFFGDYAIYFLLVPVVLSTIALIVYSYVLYERLERDTGKSGN